MCITLQRLYCELKYVSWAACLGSKRKLAFSRPCLRSLVGLIATLAVLLQILRVEAAGTDECLVREGKKPIINEKDTSLYERKLFLTPDEMARYVFLTNRYDDGDRSAAVYRALRKKGSLPGDYWLTATVTTDSLTSDHRNIRVRRHDAPLPAPTANVLHELWLAVLDQSQTDEEGIPCAPTGVLYVTTVGGARLKGVTVSLMKENSLCEAVLNLGESLIEYAKLPEAKRADAADKIEKDSLSLLKRVTEAR